MMTYGQRVVALAQMDALVQQFYRGAISIGNHPFIEFTGLMQEYVKACRAAHERGIDFSECNTHSGQVLPLESFMSAYINEKLECIFSGAKVLSAGEAVAGEAAAGGSSEGGIPIYESFDFDPRS